MKAKHLSILVIIVLYSCTGMRGMYDSERASMVQRSIQDESVFTDSLIAGLPEPIQRYLNVSGYMGEPVPFNCEVHWRESFLKLKPKDEWGELDTDQFNSVNPTGRISYMEFESMPVKGRDIYLDGYGEMKGKLFNLITVVEGSSPEIAQSAMITAFAEFPIVPGYLLLDTVVWETLDSSTVKATLQEGGFRVSGLFHFDDEGLYRRFETNDRFYSDSEGVTMNIPYTISIQSYQKQGDLMVPDSLNAVWNLPEGDYEYFKGRLKTLQFNVLE